MTIIGGYDFRSGSDNLADLPLESIITRFRDTECKRTIKTEPQDEAEWPIKIRHAPGELLSSLSFRAIQSKVSRNVLTKCASHQLVDWYCKSLGLEELEAEYWDIYEKIKRRVYSTLRIQAENPALFALATRESFDRPTTISTVHWVWGKLMQISQFVGISATDLLLVGLAWSLTTLTDPGSDGETIQRYFLPEARNLRMVILDRREDIHALIRKYETREAERVAGAVDGSGKPPSEELGE